MALILGVVLGGGSLDDVGPASPLSRAKAAIPSNRRDLKLADVDPGLLPSPGLGRPHPERLPAGHPEGVALTPARTGPGFSSGSKPVMLPAPIRHRRGRA